MSADTQVSVNPDRAVRCMWCGSFESDKWIHDILRSRIWCSRSCYWAGHFGEFAFLTLAMVIIDFFLISLELTSPALSYPNFVYLIGFFSLLTTLLALSCFLGYSNRQKIVRGK